MKNKIIQEKVTTSDGELNITLIEDTDGGYTGFFDSFKHIIYEGNDIKEIKNKLVILFEEVKEFEKDLM